MNKIQIFSGTVVKQISINLRCNRPRMPRQVEFYILDGCRLVALENDQKTKDFTIPLGASVKAFQNIGTAKATSWKAAKEQKR
ncbi:MAG: hypothetical protein LBF37_01740 [Rickettsiales bacterium]|jgi:hypothetical protein|nr:hypothetical protein [Rickettsiales bacterium]